MDVITTPIRGTSGAGLSLPFASIVDIYPVVRIYRLVFRREALQASILRVKRSEEDVMRSWFFSKTFGCSLLSTATLLAYAGTALANAGDPHASARELLDPGTRGAARAFEPGAAARVSRTFGDAQDQARRLLSGTSTASATREVSLPHSSGPLNSRIAKRGDRDFDTQRIAQRMILGERASQL
jgi:hypothetical protein